MPVSSKNRITKNMLFNQRSVQYLKDMQAKLIKSEYKITSIDFERLLACVNKIDTYQKRNGKICTLEHRFYTWMPFSKDDVKYGQKNHTSFDSSVHGLEEIHGKHSVRYLTKETKARIVQEYIDQRRSKTE
jgi:hypothetical protein